ncbi:MAG: thiamine pyrophosphate-binding protein, partial [Phreatobacter sp.]
MAEALAAHRTTCLFGLVGDANLFMVDSFIRHCGGRYVAATHEATAVLMALGYGQRTGRVGVATITHGPALTNAMTALVEGVRGGTPCVVLCGDTAPDNLQHLQKIAQRELVAATGAGFVELRGPDSVGEDVASAFRRAQVERRPIVFNMRVDLQWQPSQSLPVVLRIPDSRAVIPASDDLGDALGIIAGARRPIVLAGRGAITGQARDAMVRLARRIEAPLATTLKASGLFEGEPWNIGIFGGLSHPSAVDLIMQADCVVAFGASLSQHTTAAGSLLLGKRVVQVLARAADIGATIAPQIGLVGDPALTATLMCDQLDAAEIAPSGFAVGEPPPRPSVLRAAVRAAKAAADDVIDVDLALLRLDEALPADRIVVTDLGRFVTTAWLAFPVRAPECLIHTVNFAAIGCGLGEAIGAAIGGAIGG